VPRRRGGAALAQDDGPGLDASISIRCSSVLLAAARDWGSFDTSSGLAYVFVVGLGGLLLGLLALELYVRRLPVA
jgi:hypothetical protein